MNYPKHPFYATRKGTPKGVSGTWWKECDECGEGPSAPQHQEVPQAELDNSLLRAIDGENSEGGDVK